ncbi:sensor histidine kinase [Microbacterium sp. QXD-8]|uniref:histidine kinase n=1 Tax=Microbacterium psychrotolerans TaxID=3068321 RepID=A0ABU0YY07_9MICO|nr:sensor histidine kinase [Microbacterium sp. QXD-8]MDQ7877223.1 sensor histidine kinase [Microbacterium sp. QXD-8]
MSDHTAAHPVRRPRPTPAELRNDVWLAAGLFVSAVLSTALGSVAGVYGADAAEGMQWALLYSLGLTAPLAVRRRFPEIVVVAIAVVFFVGVTLRIPDLYVSNIAMFIAMYTVGAWVDDRRRAMWVRVGVIVAMFVWLIVTMFQSAIDPSDDALSQAGVFSPFAAMLLLQLLVNAGFFGGAYYMGDRAYAAAMSRAALEQRTRELEREREVTAAQAVALDRVRIARELHDVVAHHVSAMGVQAGAARAVLDRDPDAARTSLLGIEDSARSAIADLRQLLETLRTSAGDAEGGSTVHLSALADLVAHANDNGLPTTLTVVGDRVDLPDLVQVNMYRVAQEALTNARRHGGPDAAADVRLRYGGDAVELEVVNSGRAVAAPMRPGLGLVGMRERAAASGGVLETGPRGRGGFLVRLRVPLAAPASARASAGVGA